MKSGVSRPRWRSTGFASRRVIPIIGARTAKQVQQNLACLAFRLNADQMERLNKISQIDLGFPHAFLNSEVPRGFLYGGMADKIDF
jgi:hypothetical protein